MLVQHAPSEGAGLIATALEMAGIDHTTFRTYLGEPLPTARAIHTLGGLVVLGGAMSVHHDHDHPWLVAERDLLQSATSEGLTVLGVCLGAQQLALALGATVETGPEPEIGPGQVMLTPEGLEDPVLGPAGASFPCMHWHADTFGIPDGGVRLSGNARFANQAFRYGTRAYGLQFHVELDAELAATWETALPAGVTISPEAQTQIEAVGTGIISRLVGLADR
jgi:GMP synthase (glutamine-hydrolysing)